MLLYTIQVLGAAYTSLLEIFFWRVGGVVLFIYLSYSKVVSFLFKEINYCECWPDGVTKMG